MKKIAIIIILLSSMLLLTACGNKASSKDYTEYIDKINPIFLRIADVDNEIHAIKADGENSLNEFLTKLDSLSDLFNEMFLVDTPEEFIKTKELAMEARDYINQAKEYISESFSDTEINEKKLENGIECYNRANKRLQYIIKIIHNEPITK